MGRILCVANQKGGVGKTTTAVCLADGLAKAGARTLLVDLDPQCNATSGLGLEPTERHPLVAGEPLHLATQPTANPNLEVLPGCRTFHDVEILASGDEPQAARLQHHLTTGIGGYEYVLIDCPPSLGQLTRTALASATEVLMPVPNRFSAPA